LGWGAAGRVIQRGNAMPRCAAGLAGMFFAACAAHGATIVLPDAEVPGERKAANDLAHVWLEGTRELAVIVNEGKLGGGKSGPWFYVGETKMGREMAVLPSGLEGDGFRVLALRDVRGRASRSSLPSKADFDIILRGATGEGTGLAAGWYAQHAMGVRWFRPGSVGEVVPSLVGWLPAPMDRVVAPAFISRDFGNLGALGEDWERRNGLHGWLPHGHAMVNVFPRELFDRHPEWFPALQEGGSLTSCRPRSDDDHNWQPNFALPAVADHAAGVADEYFDRNPGETGFSLSENDSIRFDQSEATARARGPLRWFRGRPDYSDVVFGFMNRVADKVALKHPDKLLGAYAYYWCEDTPSFPVRPNVLPWLTADRSGYFDPDFEREDHALIERWCHSGARVVGIYDYLEGVPYLVPRQTMRLTAGSIQFAYGAGVRAYAAEGAANWGLDGPKLWVAAQLLWDPGQSVDALLDEYYSRYWKEAAPAMRRFDELCESTWMAQPRPAMWIKYYGDVSQVGLFSEAVRAELRADLDEAGKLAKGSEVRKRLESVSAAFAVTESFAGFCKARDALADAAVEPAGSVNWVPVDGVLNSYGHARTVFLGAYDDDGPLRGVGRNDLKVYLRNDPTQVALARWTTGELAGFDDQGWLTLDQPGPLDDRTFAWSDDPWRGRGEPVEGRSITVARDEVGAVHLGFEHCNAESLAQWIRSIPGNHYRATVVFRGRVSPGNQVFLIMNCLDAKGGYAGRELADQVPAGDWSKGRKLAVVIAPPAEATEVGMGIYVLHQMPGDRADFSGLRVERW